MSDGVLDSRDLFPRMAVGVMGSAGGFLDEDVRKRVRRFGELVGERDYVLVTGAAPGLPQDAVLAQRGPAAWRSGCPRR